MPSLHQIKLEPTSSRDSTPERDEDLAATLLANIASMATQLSVLVNAQPNDQSNGQICEPDIKSEIMQAEDQPGPSSRYVEVDSTILNVLGAGVARNEADESVFDVLTNNVPLILNSNTVIDTLPQAKPANSEVESFPG